MFKNLFSKALVAFLFVGLTGVTVSAQKIDLNKLIPTDPHVTKGQLPNGLTYYIRPNQKPENKVQLRLVVNAGSILEHEDQRGLAHFMEHMNFNGLKHFPKHEMIEFLQKIGVKFGADLNANTGFDRTYFILPIPTDQPGNLQKGFQIVADWAGGALISTDEVNAERKVVYEEMRMRSKNAGVRMRKKFFPEMLNGSRYANRIPIGTKDVIMHADPDLIRQFYHDWYRPNNMAVIVVGDITTKKAESLLKKYFGGLKNPKNAPERKYYDVKPYTQAKAMVVTDPEATGYNFSLLYPSHKVKTEKTLKDYRASLIRNIFRMAINHNLAEKTQSAQPPYSGAQASLSGVFGSLTLTDKGFSLSVSPIDNLKESVDSAVAVLLQARQYGFSKNDIDNIKQRFTAYYKKAYNERNKMRSASLVDAYTRNFMRHEPIPGIANEYKYIQAMLPTITVQEINDYAKKVLVTPTNFFALVTGPSKGKLDLPTNDGLTKMVQEAFQQQVKAPKNEKVATSLLTKAPIAGTIVSKKSDKDLGTTTYTLSNGVKVTLKSTNFKSDQIIFKGIKYGGSGQYGAADKSNAHFLLNVIGTMGYGQFTPTQLSDFLAGKTASVGTSFGALTDGVSGSSTVEDFKTLLQLTYLKLTEPRLDENLYKGFITKMKTAVQYAKSNPQTAFVDTLLKVMYDGSPLAPIQVPTEEAINNIDVNRVLQIYRKEFGNADGFHFFIVGNVDKIKNLKPLLEKYLGGLPTKGEKPMYKDNGLRMVKGNKVFKFYKGTDQKSLLISVFHGDDIKYSEKSALTANLLGQIMTNQITDTIREKMQVIYSGSASASISQYPYAHYTVAVQLPTGPKSVDAILKELKKEFKGYKTNGGPEGSLEKVKKATLEQHKVSLKNNGYWAGKLQSILFWNRSKDFFFNFDKEVNSITRQDIITMANKLLNGDRFTAISYPESAKK